MKKTLRIIVLLAAIIVATGQTWAALTDGAPQNLFVEPTTGGTVNLYDNQGCTGDPVTYAARGATVYIKAVPDIIHGYPSADMIAAEKTVNSEVAQARGASRSSTTIGLGEYLDVTAVGQNTGLFSFTMPDDGNSVSITVTFPEAPVSYINAAGQTVDTGNETVRILTGSETSLNAGWYVTDGELNYSQKIRLNGDVHLILQDGAVMNVGTEESLINGDGISGYDYSLCIYAQSTGDSKGQLRVNATDVAIYAKNVTINGGQVTANGSAFGISSLDKVTISGGQVTANGGSNGGSTGIVALGNVILGWTSLTDFIQANSYYSENGTVSIAEGKAFAVYDGETLIKYLPSGTLSNQQVSALGGKTLRPVASIPVVAPKNLTITNVTVSGATLTWEPGNVETQWQVAYSTDGGSNWSNAETVTTTTYTLTGLAAGTSVIARVRAYYNDNLYSDFATSTFTTLSPVSYIDADGSTKQCADYTVLTGSETSLAGGWYVAESELNYSQYITPSGDVHLILKDGAVMNIDTEQTPVNGISSYDYSLCIYAQSTGDNQGQLHVNATYNAIYAKNVTISGGQVTANGSAFGITSRENVTINGGQVTANGGSNGGSTGIVALGNVILGWTSLTDFIQANSYYSENGTVSIAEGKAFAVYDGETLVAILGSGTLDSEQVAALNGMTLRPSLTSTVVAPQNLVASLSLTSEGTSAKLAWQQSNDDVSLWEVSYSTDGGSNWNIDTTDKCEYTLTGLAEGQTVTVRVRTYYGGTLYSDYATCTFTTLSPVSYIDAEGNTQTCSAYTALTGTEESIGIENNTENIESLDDLDYEDSWYVASGQIDYSSYLTLGGNVHLILADGAEVNFPEPNLSAGMAGVLSIYGSPAKLNIYGQQAGTGTINARGWVVALGLTVNGGTLNATLDLPVDGGVIMIMGDITVNGGTVYAENPNAGIFTTSMGKSREFRGFDDSEELGDAGASRALRRAMASRNTEEDEPTISTNIVINGGKVTAISGYYGMFSQGDITINGGQVTAQHTDETFDNISTDPSQKAGMLAYGNITLGATKASDYIYATRYVTTGTLAIANGTTLYDEDGNAYSGMQALIPNTDPDANLNNPFTAGTYAIDGKTLHPAVCVTIPYSYGFENVSDMDYWTIITTGSNGEYTGIYDDEDDAHTGSHSFQFYYTTEPGQYLISPKLGGIASGLHVEFWYREYSEGYPETFQVGYSTTDNDPDSFTWGDEITATTSYRQFRANYPDNTKYVAVKHTSDDQYYLYLDDFLFEESPSCLEPTGVQVADATAHGATISWTAGGSETAWDIFVTADATIEPDGTTTPTVANTNNNPYNLTGLSAGTVYYVYVRAICSGTEVSEWSLPAIFATECEAMALPYEENFNAGLPVCWSTIFNPSNTNIVTQSKTSSTDPDKILMFRRYYDPNYAFAVLPEIDESYPLNGYQISFDACYYYFETNVKLSIGVMTNPADPDTFEQIDEVDITDSYDYSASNSGFGTYTVYFNNYTGNGRYIAIRDNNINSEGFVLIDNIAVSELPSCLSPTGLTANATSNSAELSWTANNGASSWTLYWKESGAEAYTEVPNLTENSYTLNGLSAATAYQFYVVAHCDENDHSAPSAVYTFAIPITLPWSEDFEGLATGQVLPVCWNTISDNSSACMIGSTNINNNNVLVINMNQSSTPYRAAVVLPEVDADYPLNQCQISFDAGFWCENSSTTGKNLGIYILDDPNNLEEGVEVDYVNITDDYSNMGRYTVLFNNYEGSGQYIALVCLGTFGLQGGEQYSYAVFIDNIEVSPIPSCLPPTNLAANVVSTSAELSWTANNDESSWTLYWKELGTEAYTEVPNVADNPYTLNGLDPSTTYEFYVVAHCDENDHSAPSAVYTFATNCDLVTLPWSEDFEGLAGEGLLPVCWNTIIDGSTSCSIAPFSGDDNNGLVISINGSSFQNSATVVLPEVDASYPLNQYQISFDADFWCENSSTTEEHLFVSIMSDPNDSQTAEMIEFVAITDAYPNIGRHTVRFNNYEGNGQYIALICRGGGHFGGGDPYAVFIDNIEVSPLPSCMPPANLIASNITGSSAQLAWTANGQSAWDIYVTNDATDVPDDNTTPTVANTEDNPYSLTGLNSLTTYYVYVRTICGENEVSEWSNRATFTTKYVITVDADNPYTQDFNDETFPPDCWELGGDPFSNWYRTVQGYAYTAYNPNYLYMPFLHLDADNAVLTFKTKESRIEFYTGGSEGDDGLSIVKVSTDGGGTWTQLWCPTINELTTDFRTVTLSLYDYVGQDILIAFEHQGHHGWTIDDVEVKVEQPTALTLYDNDTDNANTSILAGNNGKMANVTLQGRTLWKDNSWNTLCLPFGIVLDGSPLEGATLKELDTEHQWIMENEQWIMDNDAGRKTGLDTSDGTLYLFFTDAESIVAGKPYLIRWAEGTDIVDPVFTNVVIDASASTEVPFVDGSFIGIYDRSDIFSPGKDNFYLGSNNKLYYPWADGMEHYYVNALRAYFHINDPSSVRAFSLSFGEEATQGIVDNKRETITNNHWYTLDGVRLDAQPTRKGVYIHGGRKVVIK